MLLSSAGFRTVLIWEQPFQAMYEVADGQLIMRFRNTDEGVELTADLMENGK